MVPVDENDVQAIGPEVAAGAGGVILFGSSAPENLRAQLDALAARAPSRLAPMIMTDEEGGVVQRMANLVGSLPSARTMAATMSSSAIEALAETVARRMRDAGVTVDLAPVLDVNSGAGPNNRDADGTRSFSPDPAVASTDGRAFAAGLEAGGLMPVIKHFPGLGGATGNTDVTAASTPPWSTLLERGLVPFEAGISAGIPAVMVANASVPGLSALPASVSPAVITGVLRGRLGFRGLILTNSLSATALHAAGYSVPRATVAALAAGADMVLFNADKAQTATLTAQIVQAITGAVAGHTLSRDRLVAATADVLAAKRVDLCGGA